MVQKRTEAWQQDQLEFFESFPHLCQTQATPSRRFRVEVLIGEKWDEQTFGKNPNGSLLLLKTVGAAELLALQTYKHCGWNSLCILQSVPSS